MDVPWTSPGSQLAVDVEHVFSDKGQYVIDCSSVITKIVATCQHSVGVPIKQA